MSPHDSKDQGFGGDGDGRSDPHRRRPSARGVEPRRGRTPERPLRVLLAEDNPGDARLIRESLNGTSGFHGQVVHVETLTAAADRLGSEDFDVLLLDLGLPDVSGMETVRRGLEAAARAAVVVLTGREDQDLAVEALHQGVQDYVVKRASYGAELSRALRYAHERRLSDLRLRESRRLLRAIVQGTTDGIFVKRVDGEMIFANEGAARMLGAERASEVVGRHDRDFLTPGTLELVREVDGEAARTGVSMRVEEEIETRDGRRRIYDVSISPLQLGRGDDRDTILGVARDITERVEAREALRRAEQKFSTAFQVSPVAMAIVTRDEGRFLELNPSFAELRGSTTEELVGRTVGEVGLWANPVERGRYVERIRSVGEVRNLEATFRTRSGETRTVLISARSLELDGTPCILKAASDITERKAFERELERRALYDDLTGLPNRRLFADRLRHALERAARRGEEVAVLFLDLDRFKVVNDSLGHAAGDQLLSSVAERIRGCFREEDTVARLGGDEFGALLEEAGDASVARAAASRLAEELETPFRIAGTEVHAAASIGIARSSPELRNPDDLLRFSDVAMYRAKGETGTTVSVFDPERDAEATERLQLENDLRRAVEEEAFEVHFQPYVELASRSVAGVEALVRWRRPGHGLVPPADFIPVAEETGLIVPLGRQVLREAARRAAEWRERIGQPFTLSVNLSARQMRDPDLVDDLLRTLEQEGLPPEALQVEITESVAVRNVEAVRSLREHGVRAAVDDLGTGYASLEYITHLDVDALKVDRTFIAGLGEDPRDEAVVEAVMLVADRLGLPVVAEGIESEEQAWRLRGLGCRYGQGYLFARALEAAELERMLGREVSGC